MKTIRLDRYLANSGMGTRKEVKAIIQEGRVLVNGETIRQSGYIVTLADADIIMDGEKIIYQRFHYLIMNKPAGVISATQDAIHETVIDLLPPDYSSLNLFPVGRLDRDTEGLLLLTNDGQLAHRLLSPKKRVPKTYYAIIDGQVTQHDVEIFKKGIPLEEDFTTLPAHLSILESGNISKINLVIYEGKFHQVKRMFEAVDKKVTYLKRIAMGNLYLDENLALGEVRQLNDEELKLLHESI